MLRLRLAGRGRRGAVLPLTAILVVILFALVALGVDLGWIMTVRVQMQSAADSAALAGCQQLLDASYLQGTNPSNTGAASDAAMQKANAAAQAFAARNTGGGVSLVLARNEDGSGNLVNS